MNNDLHFPGQRYDAETGLDYNHFRSYDAEIGRYVSSDPIGVYGGVNVYSYVYGNPMRYTDPYGLDVTININRDTYTTNSITSKIKVTSDRGPNTFSGYSLENIYAGNWGEKLPIPPGSYRAYVRIHKNGQRVIEVIDVNNYQHIQLHVGNYVADVKGCFAVDKTRGVDTVGKPRNSATSLNEILKIIDLDGTKNITVNVTGTNVGPTSIIQQLLKKYSINDKVKI